ncbi:hypothetical protein RB195_008661 [Necator americanus]|uniref:Uncharacterized protein n=1 Tax=Necator americanus TaxID=51031 RepID=A0ABR1CPQ4_NECAM
MEHRLFTQCSRGTVQLGAIRHRTQTAFLWSDRALANNGSLTMLAGAPPLVWTPQLQAAVGRPSDHRLLGHPAPHDQHLF